MFVVISFEKSSPIILKYKRSYSIRLYSMFKYFSSNICRAISHKKRLKNKTFEQGITTLLKFEREAV